MPPQLKSLELFGYKTFASRTNLEFPGMITAIVGPNGSGKSNITDGLRWVLGEQSYSLLRGKKTEDMIFIGSEQRPRAGMAACTITLDNSNGWLPIDYTEVAITRRAYRDGQNEYLINGQKVRLKDITELLSQAGLSERNYSIIGQGLIDNSLALRPEERRKLFEEAAGIGLYRSRRVESLNRLEITRRNMERVKDILTELEPRITVLEKQAKKAEDYERIKADLRLVLREWYGYHWHKSQADISAAKEYQKKQEIYLERVKSKHLDINTQIQDLRETLQTTRQEISSMNGNLVDLIKQKEHISKELAVNIERKRSLTDLIHTSEIDKTHIAGELETDQIVITEITEEIEGIKSELDSSLLKESELKGQISDYLLKQSELNVITSSIKQQLVSLENQKIKAATQAEEKNNRINTLQKHLVSITSTLGELEEQKVKIDQDILQIDNNISGHQKQLQLLEADISVKQSKIERSELDISLLNKERDKFEQNIARIQLEINLLEQAEKNFTGYPSGAKSLLQSIRKGDISGFNSILSSQIVVPEEYELAISAAMGEFLDAVVVRKNDDTSKSLHFLETEQNGKTALIVENWLKVKDKYTNVANPALIGNALDLIQYPKEYKATFELLLSRVLVVKDRKSAVEIITEFPDDVCLVTLKGELFYTDGRIIGGKPVRSSSISHPRQKNELIEAMNKLNFSREELLNQLNNKTKTYEEQKKEVEILIDKKKTIEIQINNINSELQKHLNQKEKTMRQLEWSVSQRSEINKELENISLDLNSIDLLIKENQIQYAKLSSELDSFRIQAEKIDLADQQRDLAFLQTSNAVNQRALNELNKRIKEKVDHSVSLRKSMELLLEKELLAKKSLEALIQEQNIETINEQNLEDQIIKLKSDLEPAEIKIKETENKYNELLNYEESDQQILSSAEKNYTLAQIEYSRTKETADLLRRRIEEDFGLVNFDYADDVAGPNPLPIEGMVEQLPVVLSITSELDENITRQKSLIRRLGAVNPEAREEYETTRERFEFLSQQIADLNAADQNLRKILLDLDILMKSEFKKTFDSVAEEFPKMFSRLFGGGSARLALSDPQDISESGIEIHARLPGRREQELTLLSGGERSLTAVALVFALLKISPTPFCVLDEVDAMLDESNVGRFRDLLQEMSEKIQFILVTHNRNTVQAANIIYGITMGRDSTSQMVSLRLDDVPDEMLK